MDERPSVRLERPDRPAPRRRILPTTRLLAAAWLIAGTLTVAQVRLPDLAQVRPPRQRQAVACWGVQVASGPGSASSLTRDLRRLRRAGLPAILRPGPRPGTRLLIVPARSHAAAKVGRAKAARLGFPRSKVRRLPASACKSGRRQAVTARQDRVE